MCGSFDGMEGFYYYVELQLNSDSSCSLIKSFDLAKSVCYGEWAINNKSIEILCNRNPQTDDVTRALQGGGYIEGNLRVIVLNRNKLKIGNTILKRKN